MKVEEERLLGIAYKHFIYNAKGETESAIPADLGIVIKSNRLIDFERILEESKWQM